MLPLNEFLAEFGVAPLENVHKIGRGYFLILPEQEEFIAKEGVFGAGIFLGYKKKRFEPSPALLELIASKTEKHKARVDEKAEWLFLCGRDLFAKGILQKGEPTKNGLYLIENDRGENLGYGKASKKKNIAITNILDRGFYLRRER